MKTTAFERILSELKQKEETFNKKTNYFVPSCWITASKNKEPEKKTVKVNPYKFYADHLRAIKDYAKKHQPKLRTTVNDSIIYNLFLRTACAFDHDGDGQLGGLRKDLTLNSDGIRETGTFLKAVALLGHIRRLGCDTVYFLPINIVGQDGRKGVLGSPYAMKNPYKLDPFLKDPLLDADINTQFKAFVEAAHLLGMKVVMEFVFRTASKDADWAKLFPDWFYWIREDVPDRSGETDPKKIKQTYGAPYFTTDELKIIKDKVAQKDLTNLVPPSADYQNMFKLPPVSSDKVKKEKGRYIGFSQDPAAKEEVRTKVPGAFADWPPDDLQPPWTDVTYLRMYKEEAQSPQFNYIAYNTIRMYDKALAREELANLPLWEKIIGIVPYYQNRFGIDGVMVDMGHAMPPILMQEIIRKSKENKRDFIFLSENFSIDKSSVEQGYSAVMGYTWSVEHKKEERDNFIKKTSSGEFPIAFFATPENHNTPRSASKTGGTAYSKVIYAVNCFLPWGIPFINSGYELGETYPINTGLDFTKEEICFYSDKKLPLFDIFGYQWDRDNDLIPFISKLSSLRKKYESVVLLKDPASFSLLKTGSKEVLGFIRQNKDKSKKVYLICNFNFAGTESFQFTYKGGTLRNELTGREYKPVKNVIKGTLEAGEVLILGNEE